jgi:hypothetical protein
LTLLCLTRDTAKGAYLAAEESEKLPENVAAGDLRLALFSNARKLTMPADVPAFAVFNR